MILWVLRLLGWFFFNMMSRRYEGRDGTQPGHFRGLLGRASWFKRLKLGMRHVREPFRLAQAQKNWAVEALALRDRNKGREWQLQCFFCRS